MPIPTSQLLPVPHIAYVQFNTELHPKMAQHQTMLCGDEIQAAVVDIGTSVCRFGTAGQDVPRHIFRSDVGVMPGEGQQDKRFILGDSGLRYISKDMEIAHPLLPTGIFSSCSYS